MVAIVVALHLIFCWSSHVVSGQRLTKTSITEGGIQGQPTQVSNAMARRGLMQFPAISRTHLAFVCANQIWIVPRDGSAAPFQLSNVPGTKTRLAFSPDGQTLAFSANLDSNPNLYTLPITGGTPTRITYLPFNVYLCQWTQRNELLFYTDSLSFSFLAMQLFTVNSNGGLPVKLPVPYGSEAALSPNGDWLAYTPYWPQTNLRQTRKRYLGGIAPDIWLFNLRTHESRKITNWPGSDTKPMWRDKVVYYLSDQGPGHRSNIWLFDTASGLNRQVTFFRDYDVNNPSLGPGWSGNGEIIFQKGADLYILDLATGKSRPLEVSMPANQVTAKSRNVDASKFITRSELSSDGNEVLVGARGDIWMLSSKGGAPRNLTRTSGAFERDPTLSPDGVWVAYFSDASGEYELCVARSNGSGQARQLTTLGAGFRYAPKWSPDSKKIGFTDNKGAIYIHSIDSRETKRIDVDAWSQQADLAWSNDSNWLAYTKLGENRLSALWLCNTNSGTRHQVTSGIFNDSSPVFDRHGVYLFFISNRSFSSPAFDPLNRTFAYRNTSVLVAVPLRETAASPLATATEGARDQLDEKRIPLVIDLEGFERREVVLPTERGSLSALDATLEGNLIYTHVATSGKSSIRLFNLAGEKKGEQTVLEDESDFQLSANGRRALVRKNGALFVIEAAPGQKMTEQISTSGMMMTIDSRSEWQQIFNDVWRLYRDFFYSPNMHGLDWPVVRKQYQAMLDRAVTRDEVNYIISELIAELNVSHAWIANPGDIDRPPNGTVAMLGADFRLDNGAYRITKLYEGAPWDDGARNPLLQAGVRDGDYLLAVDGMPIDVSKDPLAAFHNKAGSPVTVTVSRNPLIDQSARQVLVKPLSDDLNLRYRAWVENNRAIVESQTKGQVGYLHVPDVAFNGLNELIRQYNGQVDKKALIIDVRWSQGGSLGDVFVHLLDQRGLNYFADRFSDNNWPVPSRGLQGPKCLLINHLVVSAGENFSYYFRKSGLGKLIGMRTWGGLVGLNGNPALIDGGYVNVPNAGFFSEEGKWLIENHGIDPDLQVVDDPAFMVNGEDPQLDVAVKLMLKEIKRAPRKPVRRPPYPDRRGMTSMSP